MMDLTALWSAPSMQQASRADAGWCFAPRGREVTPSQGVCVSTSPAQLLQCGDRPAYASFCVCVLMISHHLRDYETVIIVCSLLGVAGASALPYSRTCFYTFRQLWVLTLNDFCRFLGGEEGRWRRRGGPALSLSLSLYHCQTIQPSPCQDSL